MAEYAQSWRKKLRIKQLVDIAQEELGDKYGDQDIEKVRGLLDSEMKSRWGLIKSTRKEYFEIVQKILKKEYILNI
jgi:hypothetical protein